MIESRDFINQASELLDKKNSSEVDYRSAISRAYYSLYHESLKFLYHNYRNLLFESIGNTLLNYSSTKEHDNFLSIILKGEFTYEIISRVHVPFHRVIPDTILRISKKLGWDYKKYYKKRCMADYQITVSISRADAEILVKEIEELMVSISAL